MALVVPALVVPALIATGTAIVTGLATYFAFRPSEKSSSDTVDSKGEIQNNNTIEIELGKVNVNQNNMLVLLVGILTAIKIIEVIIYAINTWKKSLKKKYAPEAV